MGDITEPSNGNYRNTLMALAAARNYMSTEAITRAESWLKNYVGNRWLDPYTEMFLSIKERRNITSPPIIISYIPEQVGRLFGKLHMKFPKAFKWSIYLFPSAWTRNAFPPLLILSTLKNNSKVGYLKRKAIKKTEKKMLSLQLENGSWFDTVLPTMGAIYALKELGYPLSSPQIQRGLDFCKGLVGSMGNLNRFKLTVWETALAMIALLESGYNSNNDVLIKAEKFLISGQTAKGGWAFGLYNKNLPDNDDTALALLALEKIGTKNRICIQKGLQFLLGMQNDDRGFSAFDKNQSRKRPGLLPPYYKEYEHELKDPSTADVTAHVLRALGTVGKYTKSSKIVIKAVKWLKADQQEFGGWWGRWGVAYIYGTTQVLDCLKAIGEDINESYVKKAIEWLISIQNEDGGWGEHYSSYYSEKPVIGRSTIEQTSWVLTSLINCGVNHTSKTIEKGIDFLVRHQNEDGSFPKAYTAAAIDVGKYEIYSLVFPLMALAKYNQRCKI